MGKYEPSLDSINLRAKPTFDKAARLGDVLSELTESRFAYSRAVLDPISELWDQLLPMEMSEHCRIAAIRGGQLRVLVDSSAYMYELQLCKGELLSELKCRCPRAKIKGISFIIG